MVFFPENMIFFPLAGEVKDALSQEIHENMMHRPADKNRKPDI